VGAGTAPRVCRNSRVIISTWDKDASRTIQEQPHTVTHNGSAQLDTAVHV
jgi:hypothetical protein